MRWRIETGTAVVAVANGRIADPDAPVDLAFPLDDGELRAGLINCHDHLHRNHYPRLGRPPYMNAYEWGTDIHARHAHEIAAARALPRPDALLFGALKNLVGGATTVVHHDTWEPVFERGFPVRVPHFRALHSLRFDAVRVAAVARERHAAPMAIHLAEGVTHDDAGEVRTLEWMGLLDERLIAVHCVGVDPDGIRRMRRARAAMVWCPSSNLFLFGRTAPPALLDAVHVLLGTDSLLTGVGTLLDEIAAARRTGLLDDARLTAAVGTTAARVLRLPPPELAIGTPADLLLLRRPLLDAAPPDVALVVVDGEPRLGDEAFLPLFEAAGVRLQRITLHGRPRLVTAPLADVAARVLDRFPHAAAVFEAAPGPLPPPSRCHSA